MENTFDKYIRENNIRVLDPPTPYIHPTYINEEKLFSFLDDLIYNNKKALLIPDPDPDGLMSCKCFIDTFKYFSFNNYEIWDYKNKEHSVDFEAITYAIENKFDYVIILDVGTNDMVNLNKLDVFGLKSIVIDHHVANYVYDDYPESNVIINTVMNNRKDARFLYKLSAGALTFSLLYKYGSMKKRDLSFLSCYALISLYSDSVDMSPDYNRSIYYLATSITSSNLPRFVRDFIGNSVFSRRFIEFTLVPKVNALFRAEEFGILNKYFFDESLNTFARNDILNKVKEIHETARKMVDRVTDLVDREVLNNFVIANLSNCNLPDKVNKLYNYTGLIANNLAQEYSKPCIVLCDTGYRVKGSFRDLLGRNYLSIFSQFCECGGHQPAFGIHLNYVDVSDFLNMIRNTVDKKFFIYRLEDNLIVDMNDVTPNVELLNRIALYNEFAGGELPFAVVKKRHMMKELSSYNRDNYRYKWGDLTVESQCKLVLGSYVKIKPVRSKNLRLVSYSRGV